MKTKTRQTILVSEVKVGDILRLDTSHMREENHLVLKVNPGQGLFGDDQISFNIQLDNGERFETFGMKPNNNADVLR